MRIIELSEKGREFIRKECNGNGKTKLSGKNKYVLPFCSPTTSPDKVWTSNPEINGGITTDAELAEALIRIYNKYAKIYKMDANILATQAYQESAFIIWNYAPSPSSASGISQFLTGTIYEIIITNVYGEFTIAERQAISKNMIGYTFSVDPLPPKTPYLIGNDLGKQNRPIIFQNIIDNPDIMIKAQFVYMKRISKKCGNLASCTLFGYNRGPGYVKSSSYSQAIYFASKNIKTENYEYEGINYVYQIFKILYENFGPKYKKLNITKDAAKNFDEFNGNLA